MLVTFSCIATGDITMFGDDAEHLLKLMGHSGTIPSAIFAKDIPAVLERLKIAIESEEKALTAVASSDSDDHMDVGGRVPTVGALGEVSGTVTDDDEAETSVNTAGRAFPLIKMLTAAIEADCNVMWHKN